MTYSRLPRCTLSTQKIRSFPVNIARLIFIFSIIIPFILRWTTIIFFLNIPTHISVCSWKTQRPIVFSVVKRKNDFLRSLPIALIIAFSRRETSSREPLKTNKYGFCKRGVSHIKAFSWYKIVVTTCVCYRLNWTCSWERTRNTKGTQRYVYIFNIIDSFRQ